MAGGRDAGASARWLTRRRPPASGRPYHAATRAASRDVPPKRLQECGDTATIAPHHAGRAEDRRRMSQRLAAAIVPLALYCVAVVWLTWPLAAHLRTHLPSTEVACSFDTLLIAWVLAWQTHALATAPLHFAQANIYHPARHALFYCEAGVGALPYFAPAFLLTGSPALALNVTLLGSSVAPRAPLDCASQSRCRSAPRSSSSASLATSSCASRTQTSNT